MTDSPLVSSPVENESHVLLRMHGLERRFTRGDQAVLALAATDCTIHHGEFVAIVGPSGSGKSTLMYVLGCLDSPTAGSYDLAGHDVGALGDAALSRVRNSSIGYVFQQFFLLSELTVIENIALGLAYAGVDRQTRHARAQALAEQLGLGHRLTHKPLELSGGQMQRVAIARALAGEPHLILADEPTGALDSKTGDDIMAVFRGLHARGRTVILITHDQEIAAQADRVIRLVDGHIVSDERTAAAIAEKNDGHKAEANADNAQSGTVTDQQAASLQQSLNANRGGMGWRDLLRTALREGVLAHKLRSFLTMMGVIFGIAAVIIMTAITEGGKQQQLTQIRQIGLNSIQIHSRELQGSELLQARRMNDRGLNLDDLKVLREQVPDVLASYAAKTIPAELRAGRELISDVQIYGIEGDLPAVTNTAIGQGRFLDAVDSAGFRRVVVVGAGVADDIAAAVGKNTSEIIGHDILLGDEVARVVGILAPRTYGDAGIKDVSIPDRNRHVYVPFATAQRYIAQPARASELDTIGLFMAAEDSLVVRSQLVAHLLRGMHNDAGRCRCHGAAGNAQAGTEHERCF